MFESYFVVGSYTRLKKVAVILAERQQHNNNKKYNEKYRFII